MSICPQCQSENSKDREFCSVCKIPLTDRVSAETPSTTVDSQDNSRTALIFNSTEANKTYQEGKYLDLYSRYRIDRIEPAREQDSIQFISIVVTDTIPSNPSFFKKLLVENEIDNFKDLEICESINNIPQTALPYLKLDRFEPSLSSIDAAIPQIYDAWCENDSEIILVENRRSYPLLSDLLKDCDLPQSQVLYWLNEMVQLWERLQPLGVARSLLVPDNLRLDEDDNFCLQQLHYDDLEARSSLDRLGLVWQNLFARSQTTLPESIVLIIDRLINKELESAAEVRSLLQNAVEIDSKPDRNEVCSDEPTNILPMKLVNLVDVGLTDVGRQRESNEDFFGIYSAIEKHQDPKQQKIRAKGLYILCDGMGGHEAGEVASAMAVDILQDYFQRHWSENLPDRETIRQGIHLANEKIHQENLNNSSSGKQRMGTTLAMLLIFNTKVAIASVGDSRIYSLTSRSGLKQLTNDHHVANREIKRGLEPEIAYALPNAYQLTQALGPRDNNFVEPAIDFFKIHEDCLFLLCSDGLSDEQILENNWQTYLQPLLESEQNLDSGIRDLIDFANLENGKDNITAIAIKLDLGPDL